MRPQYREGYKLRYRLSRKTPLWSSMFFLISLTGPEHYIRACEFVEIKLHSPNGNGMPLSCKRARKKMRNRPPKHMRKSCQAQDLSFRDRLIDQKRERLSQDQLLALSQSSHYGISLSKLLIVSSKSSFCKNLVSLVL